MQSIRCRISIATSLEMPLKSDRSYGRTDAFHIQFQKALVSMSEFSSHLLIDFVFSKRLIAEVIREFRVKTCINFKPKLASDTNYVRIMARDECYSTNVGRKGLR